MTRERHAWFMACNCGLNCGMQEFPPVRLRGAHGAMRNVTAAQAHGTATWSIDPRNRSAEPDQRAGKL
jgi:hypothetical protein